MDQRYLEIIRKSENSALAIVVSTWGSAPRPIGSIMLVNEHLEHAGSVSGGCVEADVIDRSSQVIKDDIPVLVKYSVTDDLAFDFGLACGGDMEVFICNVDLDIKENISSFFKRNTPIYYVIDFGKKTLEWGKIKSHEKTSVRKRVKDTDKFFGVLSPTPKIILIGGGEISVAFANLAGSIGFDITVIDPRKVFSQKDRFPPLTSVINNWPDVVLPKLEIDANTALIALSHDPKIDDPAILQALNTDMFYIGALGSIRTHKKRIERLKSQVSSNRALDRIKSPAGVNIYAETAQEIALSILAEIIKEKNK